MESSSTSAQPETQAPLLELQDLCVHFRVGTQLERAVDGVSLHLQAGERLALMGESGSGKSLTALAIMGLLSNKPGVIEAGEIRFRGKSLRDSKQLKALRGRQLAMIFQDPAGALNPLFPVGEQIAECLRYRLGKGRREAKLQAIQELGRVGLSSPERRARQYPHQMSGGMLQRVMIAMAMCTGPELLIADEPTTSLDVTVQAEILALIRHLTETQGMGLLLITHDLGVVAENVERVAVMYAGKLVELAPVDAIFQGAGHPYTKLLLRSLPELAQAGSALPCIAGSPPRAGELPSGCALRTRCPLARERCAEETPELRSTANGSRVACHFPEEVPGL